MRAQSPMPAAPRQESARPRAGGGNRKLRALTGAGAQAARSASAETAGTVALQALLGAHHRAKDSLQIHLARVQGAGRRPLHSARGPAPWRLAGGPARLRFGCAAPCQMLHRTAALWRASGPPHRPRRRTAAAATRCCPPTTCGPSGRGGAAGRAPFVLQLSLPPAPCTALAPPRTANPLPPILTCPISPCLLRCWQVFHASAAVRPRVLPAVGAGRHGSGSPARP